MGASLREELFADVEAARARGEAPERTWMRLATGPGARLTAAVPFALHLELHQRIFADWDPRRGPAPAWVPAPDEVHRSNIAALMRAQGVDSYPALHAWSIQDRAGFWGAALHHLDLTWATPPDQILDLRGGPRAARWLPGARYNIVDSCLHAAPGSTAIITGGPDGALTRLSYEELRGQVMRVAGALEVAGFRPGDALAIDMPMTAEAVIIYLALIHAGMRVVSIADALAPAEVATRLRIAGAVGLFTSHTVERAGKRLPLYDKLLAADPPRTIVLGSGIADAPQLRPGDRLWADFLADAAHHAAPAPVIGGPGEVTNILFSSGTTGEPKAIPWTQLQPIKAATDAAFHFDVRPGDVLAWPTNLGWMMGPWLIYASLLNRATMALYTDAPTTAGFGAFVAQARVTVLGLVPSIVKAWRTDDRMRGLDWSALRCFGSTGEASNATDYLYLMSLAGYRPVIEYCGGTEIGGGYVAGTLVQPAAPASFSTPALGAQFHLLDEAGHPADNGEVFLVPPTLGYSESLLNRDHDEIYYAGTPPGPSGAPLRRHGDQMQRLGGGYFRALGRVDDTMNLGGIKVSSAEIERVLDGVPGVRRTAAIAVDPEGGGPSELVVYAVAAPETGADALRAALQAALKAGLNPLFRIADLVLTDSLPVTASNKIMRRELRAGYRRR